MNHIGVSGRMNCMMVLTVSIILVWLHVISYSQIPNRVALKGMPLMLVPGINVILLIVTMKKALKLR